MAAWDIHVSDKTSYFDIANTYICIDINKLTAQFISMITIMQGVANTPSKIGLDLKYGSLAVKARHVSNAIPQVYKDDIA